MENSFILLCDHNGRTILMKLRASSSYGDFVQSLCNKLNLLKYEDVSISYLIPRHPNCILDGEDDFECMIGMVLSLGLKHVDFTIKDLNCDDNVDVGGFSAGVDCATSHDFNFDNGGSSGAVSGECDVGISARRLEWIPDENMDNNLLQSFCQHEQCLLLSDS